MQLPGDKIRKLVLFALETSFDEADARKSIMFHLDI